MLSMLLGELCAGGRKMETVAEGNNKIVAIEAAEHTDAIDGTVLATEAEVFPRAAQDTDESKRMTLRTMEVDFLEIRKGDTMQVQSGVNAQLVVQKLPTISRQ